MQTLVCSFWSSRLVSFRVRGSNLCRATLPVAGHEGIHIRRAPPKCPPDPHWLNWPTSVTQLVANGFSRDFQNSGQVFDVYELLRHSFPRIATRSSFQSNVGSACVAIAIHVM